MDEKQINELLECSVCLERLDQTCKVLPCQHTFCRLCLDEIVLTKHELRCPECRALITARVADLPTNILVVRILEGLKTKGVRLPGSGGRHLGPLNSPVKIGGCVTRHEAPSGQLFRGSQPCAKALYNYESSEKEDLPFKKGDLILLHRQIDENWFRGELLGRSGFFPANFVHVLVPLPQIPQCRALYDFELKDEGEKDCISFKKDEVLTVIRRVDDNWLEGRKGDKIGIFPITFVDLNDSAISLINTKSNLTILPSSSSGQTPSSASTVTPTTASTNRNAINTNTTTAVTTSVFLPSGAGEGTSTVSSSLSSQAPLTSPSYNASGVPASGSQAQPTAAIMATSTSATPSVSTPEVLPQNKRHSYTSSSLSSPATSTPTVSSQQRHSAEVTLSTNGNPMITSSETTTMTASSASTTSSSPLPSSTAAAVNQTNTSSASPKNMPSSPITALEANGENATGSVTSSGSVQSGSLTTPSYIALYNYKPQKDDELELFKGEQYTVGEKCQDGWFKGACVRTGQNGVFPGNYVQMVRHSSAFKPVNPNVLNIRAKGPGLSPAAQLSLSAATNDQRSVISSESSSKNAQAPPLLPRVAKMSSAGQKSRSPSSQLAGPPLRSLSSPGNSISSSPKHAFSSSSSSSSSSSHLGLSRPLIPAPPPSSATSSPHRSLWVPPNLAAMQQTMSASANITPPNVVMAHSLDSSSSTPVSSGKEKKEKKEKEKKGLVKLLSGKSKKLKPTPADPEPAPPLAVLCFDGVSHVRSGSYPADGSCTGAGGDGSMANVHRKAASFDATIVPPVPAKPRPKPVPRERYCCIVPYPPQTEHELALELGDIIHVHRKREDGWFKGTQERTGKTGMFPGSFVEKSD